MDIDATVSFRSTQDGELVPKVTTRIKTTRPSEGRSDEEDAEEEEAEEPEA